MHTQARNLHGRRANKLTVTRADSFLMQHKMERANLFYHQGNISSGTKLIKYRPERAPRRLHAPTHYCRRLCHRFAFKAPCVGFSLTRSLARSHNQMCAHSAWHDLYYGSRYMRHEWKQRNPFSSDTFCWAQNRTMLWRTLFHPHTHTLKHSKAWADGGERSALNHGFEVWTLILWRYGGSVQDILLNIQGCS